MGKSRVIFDGEVLIRCREPRAYRRILEAISKESGEILIEKMEDDVEKAIEAGEDMIHVSACIHREKLEDGRCCTTIETDGGQLLTSYWGEGKGRKRGGKRSYVRVYPDEVLSLPAEQGNALMRLIGNINTAGLVIDAKKHRPLNSDNIIRLWGVRREDGFELLRAMKEAGVLTKEDSGYYVNKKYIGRG